MRINCEPSLSNSHCKLSNYIHMHDWAKLGLGRGMRPPHPNDHRVHPCFALLPSYNSTKLHHSLSLISHTPWLPIPPLLPAAVHNTPQVNRKLRWLCLGWWSGGFPSNSVRMPHIHSPLAYSNQPFIIHLHPTLINSVHNKHPNIHTDTHTRHPSITSRSRSLSNSGTRDFFVLIIFGPVAIFY